MVGFSPVLPSGLDWVSCGVLPPIVVCWAATGGAGDIFSIPVAGSKVVDPHDEPLLLATGYLESVSLVARLLFDSAWLRSLNGAEDGRRVRFAGSRFGSDPGKPNAIDILSPEDPQFISLHLI